MSLSDNYNEFFDIINNKTIITSQKGLIRRMQGGASQNMVIKQGTVLYHGSLCRDSYNPVSIKFGENGFVGFFSIDRQGAASVIASSKFAIQGGFIHKFVTKNDINVIDSKLVDKDITHIDGICFSSSSTKEYALNQPNNLLTYVETQRCTSKRYQ